MLLFIGEWEKSQIASYLQPSKCQVIRTLYPCTLRNPEECTTTWCWMSSWNLFRLLSSETYSGFQIWLRTQSWNRTFGAGENLLVIISHGVAFIRSVLNVNPLIDLMASLLSLLLFQFSSGYCHHVVSSQTPPLISLAWYVDQAH